MYVLQSAMAILSATAAWGTPTKERRSYDTDTHTKVKFEDFVIESYNITSQNTDGNIITNTSVHDDHYLYFYYNGLSTDPTSAIANTFTTDLDVNAGTGDQAQILAGGYESPSKTTATYGPTSGYWYTIGTLILSNDDALYTFEDFRFMEDPYGYVWFGGSNCLGGDWDAGYNDNTKFNCYSTKETSADTDADYK
eukprot:Pgem_evm1s15408